MPSPAVGDMVVTSYGSGPYRVESITRGCTCPDYGGWLKAHDRAGRRPPHLHLVCRAVDAEGRKAHSRSWLNDYVEEGNRMLCLRAGAGADTPRDEVFILYGPAALAGFQPAAVTNHPPTMRTNTAILATLQHTPPSDINFRSTLEMATAAEIATALGIVKNLPGRNATRVKAMETRLARLHRDAAADAGASASEEPIPQTASAESATAPILQTVSGELEGAVRAGLREVAVALIDPSPWQPREEFDAVYLSELAQSIHEVGLSQAPVVRPSPATPGRWELVVGECRLRAFRDVLHRETMPVVVKVLTDKQALEETTVENLQRRDLNPMEVARAYRQMIDVGGHTVETLSRKLARSESSIRDSLKLLELSPAAAAAVQGGRLPATSAVLLARLPAGSEAQRRVERAILQPGKYDAKEGEGTEAVLSVRAIKELTDKARERIRLDEEWAVAAAAARAAGQPTMDAAAALAAGIFFAGADHHYLKGGCSWVNRVDRCYEDPKNRNWETLLNHLPETKWVLTQAPDGAVLRLMHGEDAKDHLLDHGYDWAADKEDAEAARLAEQVERQRRETERHEQRQAEAGRLVDAAVSAAVKGEKARASLLRAMLSPIGYEDGVALQAVCQRRSIARPEGKPEQRPRGSDGTEEPHWFGALVAAAATMTSAELLGLHLEMRLYEDTAWRKSPEPEFLRRAAVLLGLEPMATEPEEQAESANVCAGAGEQGAEAGLEVARA